MIPEAITRHLFNDFAVGEWYCDKPVHYLGHNSKLLLPYCINSRYYACIDINIFFISISLLISELKILIFGHNLNFSRCCFYINWWFRRAISYNANVCYLQFYVCIDFRLSITHTSFIIATEPKVKEYFGITTRSYFLLQNNYHFKSCVL